jgi:hypothetical protein
MKTWVSNTVKVGVLSTGFLLAAGTAAHASGTSGHYTEGNHYAAKSGAVVQLGAPVKTGKFVDGRRGGGSVFGGGSIFGGGCCGGGGSIFGGGCGSGGLLSTGGVLLSTGSSCDDDPVVILGGNAFGDDCDNGTVFLSSVGRGPSFGAFGRPGFRHFPKHWKKKKW